MSWIVSAYRPRPAEHRRTLALLALNVLVWLQHLDSQRSRTLTGDTVRSGVSTREGLFPEMPPAAQVPPSITVSAQEPDVR